MVRNFFGACLHIKISMRENRRNYYGYLAGIMQKVGFVKRECLVKYYTALFQMYGTFCTFGVKSNLSPLNVTFNDGFRKICIIARHVSVRLIINGFNVLPVSLINCCL